MKPSDKIAGLFGQYNQEIEEEIKSLLNQQSHFLMYDMMRYFFGFLDENLQAVNNYGGKRFRPGLCLMISQMYGKRKEALEAATAIEIYHNFTLIHDDIEDNDPLRRGRPTVWKIWGINHGINTGDAQLILVNLELSKIMERDITSFPAVYGFLNRTFLQVVEGQFLDFTLADLPLDDKFVSEENYLMMIRNKTSVLVGAAAKAAGIISGLTTEEQEALWEYGVNLGLAFQLQDDLLSIWSGSEQTGKMEVNDIYEKKKTLPILRLYDRLEANDKVELVRIYNKKDRLTDTEVSRIIDWLDSVDSYNYTSDMMNYYRDKAKEPINRLSIKNEDKAKLLEVIDALLTK